MYSLNISATWKYMRPTPQSFHSALSSRCLQKLENKQLKEKKDRLKLVFVFPFQRTSICSEFLYFVLQSLTFQQSSLALSRHQVICLLLSFLAVSLKLSPTVHALLSFFFFPSRYTHTPAPFLSSFLPGRWWVLRTRLNNSRSLHIWTRWWNPGTKLSHGPPSNTLPMSTSIPPFCHHLSQGTLLLAPPSHIFFGFILFYFFFLQKKGFHDPSLGSLVDDWAWLLGFWGQTWDFYGFTLRVHRYLWLDRTGMSTIRLCRCPPLLLSNHQSVSSVGRTSVSVVCSELTGAVTHTPTATASYSIHTQTRSC